MQNIPLFGASATKTSPPGGTVTNGYLPLELLPAEQYNYYINAATQSVQEWVNLITLAGLTPDATQQGYTALSTLVAKEPDYLFNAGLAASVSSNALTIALKQKDGTTNPSTGVAQVQIAFRSSTAADGSFNIRAVTGALSLVIPSGATMGFSNGIADNIYVYAIDNAGTVELAVSTEALWDESLLWSTTVLDTASDSRTVLYSTTARSNVPIRFLGRLRLTEATAGTWATAPANYAGPYADQSGVIDSSGSGISLTSPNAADICSIIVPPGKWDISGGGAILGAATTNFTVIQVAVSGTSATIPSPAAWATAPLQSTGEERISVPVPNPAGGGTVYNSTGLAGMTIPTYRVNFATQTTLYLVIQATFTVSTAAGRGWIQARRVTK